MGISMLRILSVVSDGILLPALIEVLIRKQSESVHSLGLVQGTGVHREPHTYPVVTDL